MKKEKTISFPQTFDELTPDDFRIVLQLRQRIIERQLPATSFDIRAETAAAMLSSRGVRRRTDNPQYISLVAELADSLSWLWTDTDLGIELRYRCTANLLPSWRKLRGPISHGADLSFGEYRTAIGIIQQYADNPSVTLLQTLAGLLYRPTGTRSQRQASAVRRPYDIDSPARWQSRGATMPLWFLWGVYLWFCYFCEYLTTGTFIINHEQVSFAPIFQQSGSGRKSSTPVLEAIALTMAESGIFGTIEDVEHANLLRIMMKLLNDHDTLQQLRRAEK